MDKIIKIALGLFIVILVLFVAIATYTTSVDTMYRNSLTSNYQYICTISTNDVLSNVTLFLPVPADSHGDSPVVAQISSHEISGAPADWNLTLYGTGKATLLQVSAPMIGQRPANGVAQPTTITLIVNASSSSVIDTSAPVENAAVFRPVQNLHTAACPSMNATSASTPVCYQYLTSMYADYTANPAASLSVSASVTGINSWNIFSPASNMYQNNISVLTLHGSNHGWVTSLGWIESGIGSYNVPSL
ncbi:hypothetical protein [Methanoregula sp.]|uniref:hypothetical protein n=1 Tax=Methanoregula sp. TaxID=2052170 RepID=UPI002B734EA9|nr:hypothetical protein [Methanoregula sp.]HVP97286.1 hypothetical protein [Methanoregula sp.]